MVGMKHNLKQTSEIAESAAGPKTKLSLVLCPQTVRGKEILQNNLNVTKRTLRPSTI